MPLDLVWFGLISGWGISVWGVGKGEDSVV